MALYVIVSSSGVLAVLTSESGAARAAAEAGGRAAKVSVSTEVLSSCGSWSGVPLMVAVAIPELRTPVALMKMPYGPHRIGKCCLIKVILSGWWGISNKVSAWYSYSNIPRTIAEA